MNYDVPYMQRTRDYYRAQGYQSDYQWAKNDTTPFQPFGKPLSASRVALITTAMPDTPNGRQTRAIYSTPIEPLPKSLYTKELSWHHGVTHTDDVASILPIKQLNTYLADGQIGSLAEKFHSLPTEYSQRATKDQDGPEILRRCQEQEADVAILVPL